MQWRLANISGLIYNTCRSVYWSSFLTVAVRGQFMAYKLNVEDLADSRHQKKIILQGKKQWLSSLMKLM